MQESDEEEDEDVEQELDDDVMVDDEPTNDELQQLSEVSCDDVALHDRRLHVLYVLPGIYLHSP